jgi:hypothetical protein
VNFLIRQLARELIRLFIQWRKLVLRRNRIEAQMRAEDRLEHYRAKQK